MSMIQGIMMVGRMGCNDDVSYIFIRNQFIEPPGRTYNTKVGASSSIGTSI